MSPSRIVFPARRPFVLRALLAAITVITALAVVAPVPAAAQADFNGDGFADVVLANAASNHSSRVCFGDRAGGFESCSDIGVAGLAATGVAAGDVDRDGDLDVVLASDLGNRVCRNDGRGSFACATLAGESGDTVALGDLDADGDLDAIFASYSRRERVCKNDGGGAFTCSNFGATDFLQARGVALGDLDRDGDLDVVVPVFSKHAQHSQVCRNDGRGRFACSDLPDALTTVGAALGDLDADGDLDIAFANLLHTNRACMNNGRGGFTCVNLGTGRFNTQDVALGDIDGDGDLDAMFANFYYRDRICTNDGSGAFTCSDMSADTTLQTRAVTLGDSDADGDLDAVFANEDQVNRVCTNDGKGGFTCSDVGAGAFFAADAFLTGSKKPRRLYEADVTNNAPVAVCKDATLAAGAACSATAVAGDVNNGSSDPDAGDTLTLSLDSPGPFAAGSSHTVTLTATDSQGASSSCTATVTVVDSTPPALAPPPTVPVWDVMTLAGPGGAGPGATDGTGTAARFNFPYGVAIDGSGNVYVADSGNNTIRKITPAGVVTTLAGMPGVQGSTNGTGSAARFNFPTSVAVDGGGNVYVSDTQNQTIRKITPAGVVTTLAGTTGFTGSTDGTGSAARFNYPSGVTVDSAGNVYVADSSNTAIRKITPAGVVTTFAGSAGATGSTDGTGSAARFFYPTGLAVDSSNNIYVADRANQTIRKITPTGVVTTLAGTPTAAGSVDGTGSTARFFYPNSLTVDSGGNVFVVDEVNQTIRKVTPAGVVTTLAGAVGAAGSVDGTGFAARFNTPHGVAADGAGNVYVADSSNHNLRKITPAGVVTTLAGPAGATGGADGTGSAARFFLPIGVAADGAGNVYVADTSNHTIRKITPAGVVTTLAGTAGIAGNANGTGSAARFRSPRGVAVDSSGNVYVADTQNYVIRKITVTGVVTTLAGSPGSRGSTNGTGSTARFDNPSSVAIDGAGNVYVADTLNHTIRKITPAGVVTTLAGTPGVTGSTNGTGSAARFLYPAGVAVDGVGNVYVADTYNHTIRKVTAAGVVTTLAGSPGVVGSTNGTGNAARLYFPNGVAVDGSGDVYVADTYNHTIRKVTAAGVVTTLAGTALAWDSVDGRGSAARFNDPNGVAVDGSGNLYVADTDNSTIRKLTYLPPMDYSAIAGASCQTALPDFTARAVASDNCGPVTLSQNPAANTLVASGHHPLRITATDGAGNQSFVDVFFDVNDVTPPTLTPPMPAVVAQVTTLAGPDGGPGSADGAGSAARFNSPQGVAVDSVGNVYVADSYNSVIRKITPAGAVTTFAGTVGAPGSADGTGSGAQFWAPLDVAVDADGNVYVADTYNHTIRKITAAGAVTTLAGTVGAPGSADGTGATASFNSPSSVAVDGDGNVYVADKNNHTIRKIAPDGVVTTLAGTAGASGSADGTGNAAGFNSPSGVAVDGSGNVYVGDTNNYVIRKITPAGVVTTLAGAAGEWGSVDGPGSAARFSYVYGLAVDGSGNVYVADTWHSTIRKITAAGNVTTLAGTADTFGGADGTGGSARFFAPRDVAVDADGNAYVADTENHEIRKITPGGAVTTLAGPGGGPGSADGPASAARFYYPNSVAADGSGNVYVADSGNNTIRKITPTGVVTTLAGMAGAAGSDDGTSSAARFRNPEGVAVDGSGNVYVADSFNATIRKITPAGTVTTLAGMAGTGGGDDGAGSTARFYHPTGVAVDGSGNVYVTERYHHTVRKVTAAGVVTTLAGVYGAEGTDDGTGNAARFSGPVGVAVDGSGNVYVVDQNSSSIRKITPAGAVTTLAGTAGLNRPWGVAVDASGNVYVGDTMNNMIRRITPAGALTTLAGSAYPGGRNGTGSDARFQYPNGVAVGGGGIVYVADTFNHEIRKITLTAAPYSATADAGCAAPVPDVATEAVAADACGAVNLSQSPPAGTPRGPGHHTVRVTATDGANNQTSFDVFFDVTDAAPPAFTVPPVNRSAPADETCQAQLPNFTAGVVADDNCGGVALSQSPSPGSLDAVTTLAGTADDVGSADGTGSAARFNGPFGTAVDGSGNLYVADSANNKIRKITPSGVVTTLAGDGTPGSADGTGNAARFYEPTGVAVDGSGNVYVADASNHAIRKITLSGVVTTLAGTAGVAGDSDGTGSAALFYVPIGVAVDGDGTVYVTDSGNNTLRKITPTGEVTTLAGVAGVTGDNDGTGSAARFNWPTGVAVDSAGTVYVGDEGNQTVRKISSAGVVTTLAGTAGVVGSADGIGSAARFYSPRGVAVDGSGNVYIADAFNQTIRKITASGAVTTLAGTAGVAGGTDGNGSAARFSDPSGVAVDGSGTIYVADNVSATIRRIGPAAFPLSAGRHPVRVTATDTAGNASFFDVFFDVDDTTPPVFTATPADQSAPANASCQAPLPDFTVNAAASDACGSVTLSQSYTAGTPFGAGHHPVRVTAVDAGGNASFVDVFFDVSDTTPPILPPAGSASWAVTTLAGTADTPGSADGTGSDARFYYPNGVAADSGGNVYVADRSNHTIRKITPAGEVTTLAGTADTPGSTDGTGSDARFASPVGVAVDNSGNVYVADTDNNTIRKITAAGVVTTLAGTAGTSGADDGTGNAARFYGPSGVAVDNSGNVYVADTYNLTIRKITPDGVVTTLAGTTGASGATDGTGSAARFGWPRAVAVDGSGNVYVADEINSTIRKITPDGEVTTLAGAAGAAGVSDGTGSAARFTSPQGVAVDGSGNLYVTDTGNRMIRKITAAGVVTRLAGTEARFNYPIGMAVDGSGNLYVGDYSGHTIRKIAATTFPAAFSAFADASCLAMVPDITATVVASDSCGTVTLSQNPAAGTPLPLGHHVVRLTATDAGGNESFVDLPFDITDNTPPDFTVPPVDQSAPADASCQAPMPDFTASAAAGDACGAVTLSQSFTAGTPFGAGHHAVRVTATDEGGNASFVDVYFDVADSTLPDFTTLPADQSAPADASCQALMPDFTSGTAASDSCGAVTLSQSPDAGTPLPLGHNPVRVTATDTGGNQRFVDVVFDVTDNLAPDFTVPPVDQSASADANCQAPMPDFIVGAAAGDACGTVTLSQSLTAGTPFGAGHHAVRVTATDGGGNETFVDVFFDVTDDTPPVFTTAPVDLSAAADTGCETPVADFTANAVANDACGAVTLNQSPAVGTLLPLGHNPVRVIAADEAGNPSFVDAFFDVADPDGDGVCGSADNCQTVANPGQSNIDSDAFGDVCDVCPDDALNTCNPGGSTAREIAAATGGTVQTPDGKVTVGIDPGDLAADTTISVTKPVVPNSTVNLFLNRGSALGTALAVYDLKPDGLVFDHPVALTMIVDVTGLSPLQKTQINFYRLNTTTSLYEPVVPRTCTFAGNVGTCTVQVAHFSRWAAVVPLDSDGDGIPDLYDEYVDSAPFNPRVCRDADADTCDDCTSGISNPANDGPDSDGDGACNAGDVCPLAPDDAALLVRAERHTVGTGSHPVTTKTPLAGLPVGIYDKSRTSCAVTTCGGTSWQQYNCIYQSCQAVKTGSTNAAGEASFRLAPGDYLVIGGSGVDKHLGVPSGNLACGDHAQKYLQEIVKADGKTVPATTSIRTGSRLLIIEPEVVEWTSAVELYPVIFESEGDWTAEATVAPPEGFVADYSSLSAQVTDELEAVQFTLTDVGSDWVPTEIQKVLRHKGRREILLSRVGVRLSPELAAARHLDRYGHPLGSDGHPLPHQGFDPRAQRPAEIVGWIEASAVDAQWTVKLRVTVGGNLSLAITRGQGEVVKTLASGYLTPGDYEYTWDGNGGHGQYFVKLVAGDMVQKAKLTEK
jgi:hypothetical protein